MLTVPPRYLNPTGIWEVENWTFVVHDVDGSTMTDQQRSMYINTCIEALQNITKRSGHGMISKQTLMEIVDAYIKRYGYFEKPGEINDVKRPEFIEDNKNILRFRKPPRKDK